MTDSREKPDIFYLKTKKEFGKFVYKVNLYLNLAILINFVIYSQQVKRKFKIDQYLSLKISFNEKIFN